MSRTHDDAGRGCAVEEVVSTAVVACKLSGIVVDVSLDREVENRAFEALVVSPSMKALAINRTDASNPVEASDLLNLLQQSLQKMPRLKAFHLIGSQASLTEAEGIFASPHCSSALAQLPLDFGLGGSCDEVATALSGLLRRQSYLPVMKMILLQNSHAGLSEHSFCSMLSALAESAWLRELDIQLAGANQEGVTRVTNAIVSSSPLHIVGLHPESSAWKGKELLRALPCSDATRKLDLLLHVTARADHTLLTFRRTSHWKGLMPKDTPLTLWPRALAKANGLSQQKPGLGRASLGALRSLTRKKSMALLQESVHRHRIRKCKRFQLS